MSRIKIAIAGLGNCASSLLQGIEYYRQLPPESTDSCGLMHYSIGPYRPFDIELVAVFDIDRRKVGRPAAEAIFAPPNNTKVICSHLHDPGPVVQMGPVLDGFPTHMLDYPEHRRFVPARQEPVDVTAALRDSGAQILMNYLPVGSQKATEFYAQAALDAGVSLVNCIPVFIVSHPAWAQKFKQKGLPCVGDDVKAQIGATIVHRALTRLFEDRGVRIEATYQLNTGGNTDFMNMLDRSRLSSKKVSKTEAVQSQLASRLDDEHIHIGPSDYVAWQNDNKVCFLRMEGRGFASVPLELELRLSVEDSPNSAGVAIDAIRLCKLAIDHGISGPLLPASAYYMKHPPTQMKDADALTEIERFLWETAGAAGANGQASPQEQPRTLPIVWPDGVQRIRQGQKTKSPRKV
jgi:myo-inositol-1-phosphate synthase